MIYSEENVYPQQRRVYMKDVTLPRFAVVAFNTGSWVGESKLLESYGLTAIKEIEGVYRGNSETSWMIVLKDEQTLDVVRELASIHKQESILIVDHDRSAQLEYNDYSTESLGYWKSVPQYVATKQDNYSFHKETDTYYICQ